MYLLCYFLHLVHVCCHGSLTAHVSQLAPGVPDTNKNITQYSVLLYTAFDSSIKQLVG